MKNTLLLISAAFLLAAVLTFSHALLRSASIYASMENPWIFRVGAALFLYGLVFISYTFLLKYFDISVLYPTYTALSIIGVSLVGVIFFNEGFSAAKVFGLIFLVFGVGLVSM